MAFSATVCRGQDQVSTELDGEVVLMSIEQGKYYQMSAIASDIWRRLAQPQTVAALCDDLGQSFDAPADVIRADVLALLNRMHRERLIEIAA